MSHQVITTKYVGATLHKTARIIASNRQGNRVVISRWAYDTNEEAHRGAVKTFCERIGWDAVEFIGGLVDGGDTFVWVNTASTDRVSVARLTPKEN